MRTLAPATITDDKRGFATAPALLPALDGAAGCRPPIMERPETLLALAAVPENPLPRTPARMAAGEGRAGIPAGRGGLTVELPPDRRAEAAACF